MNTTARTLLFDLITDVEQLVTAGAENATGHERLQQHAQRLEKLSLQVPALNRFLPLVHRVISADKNHAAHDLLQLLTQTRRLRASIAEPKGLQGELRPIQGRAEWKSDTPLPELISEVGRISRSRPYRAQIREGTLPAPQRDLRMVGRILAWIETGHQRFANSLIEEVVPKMGPSMARELAREPFDADDLGDMNRLVALAKLDSDAALASISEIDADLGAYLKSDLPVESKPKKRKAG
jgi:hypothetical protein